MVRLGPPLAGLPGSACSMAWLSFSVVYSPTYCPRERPYKQKLASHLEREPWSVHSGGQTEQLLWQGERDVSTLPS